MPTNDERRKIAAELREENERLNRELSDALDGTGGR